MKLSAGLPYIKMRPVTKEELVDPDIPHVIYVQDGNWKQRHFDDELSHQDLIERIFTPDNTNHSKDEPFILDTKNINTNTLRTNKGNTVDNRSDIKQLIIHPTKLMVYQMVSTLLPIHQDPTKQKLFMPTL